MVQSSIAVLIEGRVKIFGVPAELKANLAEGRGVGDAGGRGIGEAVGRDLDVEEMSLILLRMLYSKCEFILHKVLKCWS